MLSNKFNGCAPDGRRLLYKGGGGGTAYYGNLDELYSEQAASAKLLRDQAEKYLPGTIDTYMSNVSDVQNPSYVQGQAEQAASDMANANAMETRALDRNLVSLGVNPNSQQYVNARIGQVNSNAARMAAGENLARNQAKAYQRAVTQDALGTLTGTSNNASSQLMSSASGLSSLYSTQNQQRMAEDAQQSANTANAIGGAYALMMKDGGKVSGFGLHRKGSREAKREWDRVVANGRPVEHHFFGGMAGAQQKGLLTAGFATPTPPPSTPVRPQVNPLAAGVQGIATGQMAKQAGAKIFAKMVGSQPAAPVSDAAIVPTEKLLAERGTEAAADQAAKAAAEKTGEVATQKAAEVAAEKGAETAAANIGTGAAATEAATTGAALTGAGEAAAGTGAAMAGTGAAAAGATGAAATTGAAAAGTSALGAGAAALGTAMPWIGAGLAIGSALGWFADGGAVDVQDFRPGGHVSGPGTHTSDSVPAMLSDGEGVLNAEAMALGGEKVMNELNAKGLEMRERGITPERIRTQFGIKRAE
ncbi:MAG: hypothetical protein HGA47_04180 [Zoogloea sp.]|nr:hypothetical protein [Zoogloea sp.]